MGQKTISCSEETHVRFMDMLFEYQAKEKIRVSADALLNILMNRGKP